MSSVLHLRPGDVPRVDDTVFFELTPAMRIQIKNRNAGRVGAGGTFAALLSEKSIGGLKRDFEEIMHQVRPINILGRKKAQKNPNSSSLEPEPDEGEESDSSDGLFGSPLPQKPKPPDGGAALRAHTRELKRSLTNRHSMTPKRKKRAQVDPLLARWCAEWAQQASEGLIGHAPEAYQRDAARAYYTTDQLATSAHYATLAHFARFLRKNELIVEEKNGEEK